MGTLDARRKLKIEKPVTMLLAGNLPVRNDGDDKKDGEEWTDLRYMLKVESQDSLKDWMLEVRGRGKPKITPGGWLEHLGQWP